MALDDDAPSYVVDAENPWPGLAWFGEDAASFFKGRSREVAELKRLVTGAPLTALFGRSGLGKTSLLRAGLFPALRHAGFLPVYVRLDLGDSGPLIEQLFRALVTACTAINADAPARVEAESLWEYLHRSDFRIWSAQNHPLIAVFVIDQFEEVHTIGRAHAPAVTRLREDLADLAENRIPVATEQRLATDEAASARLALRRQPCRVLLSFREDFATAFERWQELPSLMRNRLQLLPLAGSDAFAAVYEPASHLMTRETAEQIVRFVASQKRDDASEATTPLANLEIEPALLSLICRGLNESRKKRRERGGPDRIDRELLASSGAGVVDRHYDDCMRDQPDRVHRFVENELVTESGYRNPCAQDDAMREPYLLSLDALRVLVDRRLLRFEPSLGVTRIELIHDLLAPTVVARRDARRRVEQQQRFDDQLREHRARQMQRVAFAVAAVAVLVAIGVGLLLVYARRQAQLAAEQASLARSQAQVAHSRELASAAITRLDLDPELAVRLALEAAAVAPTDQAESALRQALFRWPRADGTPGNATGERVALPLRELRGHTDDVMAVAFSPDGTRVLSVSCDTTARLWDVVSGQSIRVLRDHRASISQGAFSHDGRSVLTAGGNPCLTHPDRVEPDDTDIRVWDADTGRIMARLTGETRLLVGAAFSPDGHTIVAGGINGEVLMWTLPAGTMQRLGEQGEGLGAVTIQSVAFSPDGAQVATAGLDGSVVIWDPRTSMKLTTLHHNAGVLALAYATAGGDVLLASVDLGGMAKVWDARTFVERREIKSYGPINSTAFSQDARFLVTAGADLSLWEMATGARMQALANRQGSLFAASISADGQHLAVGGDKGFLAVLDCNMCVPMNELLALAGQRRPRPLTDQERRDFGVEPR